MATASMAMTCTCTDCGRLVDISALTSHDCRSPAKQPLSSSRGPPPALASRTATSPSATSTTVPTPTTASSTLAGSRRMMPFLNKYAQRGAGGVSPRPKERPTLRPSPFDHEDDLDDLFARSGAREEEETSEIAYLSSPDLIAEQPRRLGASHDRGIGSGDSGASGSGGGGSGFDIDIHDRVDNGRGVADEVEEEDVSDSESNVHAALDDILGQLTVSSRPESPVISMNNSNSNLNVNKNFIAKSSSAPDRIAIPAKNNNFNKYNNINNIKNIKAASPAAAPSSSSNRNLSSSNNSITFNKSRPIPPSTSSNSLSTSASPRVCSSCGDPLSKVKGASVQRDSLVFCRSCYSVLYLPKCRKCRKPIEAKAIQSRDGKVKGKYHPDCFSCFKCSAPFPNRSFYVWEEMPYCEHHYHVLAGTLCQNSVCGRGIEGPCVTLDDGTSRYHPNCFKCYTPGCPRKLTDWHYLVDGKPYCQMHAERLQRDTEFEYDDHLGRDAENDSDDSYGAYVRKKRAAKASAPNNNSSYGNNTSRIKKRQTIIQDVSALHSNSPKAKPRPRNRVPKASDAWRGEPIPRMNYTNSNNRNLI